MADLVERLRGSVREAASRLIAGAFRRDGERLEQKRPRFSIPARPDEDDDLVLVAALEEAADRLSTLEAERRAGCMCRGVEIGSHAASVTVPIPDHMADYRDARVRDGLSPSISVDACLVVELRHLWSKGIRTYGSCCGHNKVRGMINVHEDDADAMRAMSYEQWPAEAGKAEWTFYPLSVGALPGALEASAAEGERRGLERAAASWRRIEPASRKTVSDYFGVSEDDLLVAIATADGIADALRALIPGAPVREVWMLIETAPKDGTSVLVAVPTKDQDDFIVGEAYCNEERGGWWWANFSDGDYYASPIVETQWHPPSHWRPLPSPPQGQREG